MLHHPSLLESLESSRFTSLASFTSCPSASVPAAPCPSAGRRRWTAGELAEIVAALASLRTNDIARAIGVNPKALRSVLRRHGISIRALRQIGKKNESREGAGLVVRRPNAGPSAVFGAAALMLLPDGACRWPLGDPAEPDFSYCGAPRAGRASYCRHHLRQAFEREDAHERGGSYGR